MLSVNHWNSEYYRERITTKEWKEALLNGDDRIMFHGHLRTLVAKSLGSGVVEIGKEPLE